MGDGAPKTILVTGGNRGIDRLAVAELARRGHRVLFTARRAADGSATAAAVTRDVPGARVEPRLLDLASFTSVRELADTLAGGDVALDAVLHNAGTLVPPARRTITADGIEQTLQIHVVGPYLLSTLLLPVLARPSRLVLVGSGLHAPGSHGAPVRFRFDDPFLDADYHPERAYKNAKLAQLWLTREWERRHGDQGVHADNVCPGFVPRTASASATGRTRLLLRWVLPRMPFATTPGAAASIEADWAARDGGEPGGRYFDGGRITEPSDEARDPGKAAAFWDLLQRWAPIR